MAQSVLETRNRPQCDLALAHPEYQEAVAEGVGNRAGMWEKVLDCIDGEETVKAKGEKYLPKTATMRRAATPNMSPEKISQMSAMEQSGTDHYNAYRARAEFPDWTHKAAEAMSGMVARVEPTIEVPERLMPMREHAMADGRSVFALVAAILDRQIKSGRVGVLLDALETQQDASPCPRALLYHELNIVNWHSQSDGGREWLDYVLLDESAPIFDEEKMTYANAQRYRVLALDADGWYYTLSFDGDMDNFALRHPPAEAIYPAIAGQRLNVIPFVFFNANGNTTDICRPPLAGIANNALSAYRISADYRQSMYNCGQATLFVKGVPANTPIAVGATTAITTNSETADARWLEISGSGLQQMADRWAKLEQESKQLSVELTDNNESGKALNTRLAVKTASLVGIANACQSGMTMLLDIAARWTNADPDEIRVQLDTDFNGMELSMQEIQIMASLVDSSKMTERDYWQYLRDRRWTSAETYEEWKNDLAATALPDFVGMARAAAQGQQGQGQTE